MGILKDLLKKCRSKPVNERAAEVGVFTFVGNELYMDAVAFDQYRYEGFMAIPYYTHGTHSDLWAKSKTACGQECKNKSWDYYPRGRVVFDIAHKQFYLYVDQHIKNDDNLMSEVARNFSLPSNTKVRTSSDDDLYKCEQCRDPHVKIMKPKTSKSRTLKPKSFKYALSSSQAPKSRVRNLLK